MKNVLLTILAALLAFMLVHSNDPTPSANAQTPVYDWKYAPSSACQQTVALTTLPNGTTTPFAVAPAPWPPNELFIPHHQDPSGVYPHILWEQEMTVPGTNFYCPIIRDNLFDTNALKEVDVHVADGSSSNEITCTVYEIPANPNVAPGTVSLGSASTGVAWSAGYKKLQISIASSRAATTNAVFCSLGSGVTVPSAAALLSYSWRELGPSDSK